jgi:hypothetical protein
VSHVVDAGFAESLIQGFEPIRANNNQYHFRAVERLVDLFRESVASIDAVQVEEQRIGVEPMTQSVEEPSRVSA